MRFLLRQAAPSSPSTTGHSSTARSRKSLPIHSSSRVAACEGGNQRSEILAFAAGIEKQRHEATAQEDRRNDPEGKKQPSHRRDADAWNFPPGENAIRNGAGEQYRKREDREPAPTSKATCRICGPVGAHSALFRSPTPAFLCESGRRP